MHKPTALHGQSTRLNQSNDTRAGSGSPPRKPGFRVSLSPAYNRRCSCGALLDYSHPYDAEFCRACDRWWAKSCRDPSCEFCAKRPARPSLAADLDPAPRIPFNPPKFSAAKQGRRR